MHKKNTTHNKQTNSIKDKQCNGPQNTTQKTKDLATRTPLRTGVNPCDPEWLAGHTPLVAP